MKRDLAYPPPWQDKATLAAHLSISTDTVETWAATGIIPAGRMRGGKLMWKWKEVDDKLTLGEPGGNPDSQAERIRNGTRSAANEVRSH